MGSRCERWVEKRSNCRLAHQRTRSGRRGNKGVSCQSHANLEAELLFIISMVTVWGNFVPSNRSFRRVLHKISMLFLCYFRICLNQSTFTKPGEILVYTHNRMRYVVKPESSIPGTYVWLGPLGSTGQLKKKKKPKKKPPYPEIGGKDNIFLSVLM